jgi:DNA gyrase/topoisomerase IV subunit B
MVKKTGAYTAEDIEILEDLSPILHRPGMYTDPVNPNHALVEVIDNAADEGLAGFATKVAVVLYEDGSASVEDDGRGIPVDIPRPCTRAANSTRRTRTPPIASQAGCTVSACA